MKTVAQAFFHFFSLLLLLNRDEPIVLELGSCLFAFFGCCCCFLFDSQMLEYWYWEVYFFENDLLSY